MSDRGAPGPAFNCFSFFIIFGQIFAAVIPMVETAN